MTRMTVAVAIKQLVPVLQVSSVDNSIDWYRKILGFAADPFPATPPFQFAILRLAGHELMLQLGPEVVSRQPKPYRWDIYIRLEGQVIRQIYECLRGQPLVVRPLERTFYGMAEFEVADIDGYNLCLAEDLDDLSDLPLPKV